MPLENAAELRNIRHAFGNNVALDRVSLSLQSGVTGLLGPNGAGKSTLLRVLATGLEPDGGLLELFGEPVDHGSRSLRSARRSIGFMPQQAAVYPNSRVDEFLGFVALLKEIEPKAARAAEVDRVLAVTDLVGRRKSRIKALSGGMRQRVSLASSLLGSPGLLILDEPTVGLDPEQRIRFREAISQVSRDCAVVLSTHQTDDVALLCNRVIVLQEGSIKFQGATRALADLARGHVWLSDQPSERSLAAWLTGDGRYRCIGNPADGDELVEPTIDDGYLWLTQVSRPKVIQ